jgi:hypothetical protein
MALSPLELGIIHRAHECMEERQPQTPLGASLTPLVSHAQQGFGPVFASHSPPSDPPLHTAASCGGLTNEGAVMDESPVEHWGLSLIGNPLQHSLLNGLSHAQPPPSVFFAAPGTHQVLQVSRVLRYRS